MEFESPYPDDIGVEHFDDPAYEVEEDCLAPKDDAESLATGHGGVLPLGYLASDTCANRFLFNFRSAFKYVDSSVQERVDTTDKAFYTRGVGPVDLAIQGVSVETGEPAVLHDVIPECAYTPDARACIFAFTPSRWHRYEWDLNSTPMTVCKNGIVCPLEGINGLVCLKVLQPVPDVPAALYTDHPVNPGVRLWHRRLTHLHRERVKQTLERLGIDVKKLGGSIEFCDPC